MAKKQIAKTSKKTTAMAMPKFVTKGNRVIPIYPGFEVVPGYQAEGSLLLIKDPETGTEFRYISKSDALKIVNKALSCVLVRPQHTKNSLTAKFVAQAEKAKQSIVVARAIYQEKESKKEANLLNFLFVF